MKTLDEIKGDVAYEFERVAYKHLKISDADEIINEIATRFATEQTADLEHKLTDLMYIQKDNDDKVETIEQMKADILTLIKIAKEARLLRENQYHHNQTNEFYLERVMEIDELLTKTAHYEN